MPKNDTWPGGVAMESLSSRDSAGSYDSVISMNSACSEDSMEHLSAEERACLMYLEETIEALEVQEDSGLSNDEPEPAEKMDGMRVNDISSVKSESGSTEHRVVTQISEAESTLVLAANRKDAVSASLDLVSKHKSPLSKSVTGSKSNSQAAKTKMLCVAMDGEGKPRIVASGRISPGLPTEASEIDLCLIPPPSDFMDEPEPPAQPQSAGLHPSLGISTKVPRPNIDSELVRQRFSVKRTSLSPSVTQENQNKSLPEVSPSLSPPDFTSGPPEATEPRNPPVVAPRPIKLPPNIVLNSQKVSAGPEGNSGHSGTNSSDRVLLDPQRVRIEALRKLGLLKREEADSGPSLSPKHSPQSRRSWPAPPSEASPMSPHTPPLTPSNVLVSSPPPASVSSLSPAAASPSLHPTAPPARLVPDILPAPSAFSDPVQPLLFDNKRSPVKDASDGEVNVLVNMPPLTPPALTRHLTPPKITGVKSATLERSGLGLSTCTDARDSGESSQGVGSEGNLSQLRNSRPRPASLGSGKEFSSAQGEGFQARRASSKVPGSQRPLSALQHPGDSQKLPRSQGISVLICPRAENGEDRRKALKKLGLLRD